MSCLGKRHLLEIKHLSISFKQYTRAMAQEWISSISDLNAYVHEGEIVAIVGASGSGKSLLAHAVLGILPENAKAEGMIFFDEKELDKHSAQSLRGKEIALIPQSTNSLDPLMKVGAQVRGGRKDKDTIKRQRELFAKYGLSEAVEGYYPHECSGGMLRRILLCTALITEPRLIIADEPTTGMDRELAERAMADLREFTGEKNGVLLITHDLELAVKTADRVAVFYAGTTIEEALSSDFEDEALLRHPYTKALWRALPENDFVLVEGTRFLHSEKTKGCVYKDRCEYASKECEGEIPFYTVDCGSVRCIRYRDRAEA